MALKQKGLGDCNTHGGWGTPLLQTNSRLQLSSFPAHSCTLRTEILLTHQDMGSSGKLSQDKPPGETGSGQEMTTAIPPRPPHLSSFRRFTRYSTQTHGSCGSDLHRRGSSGYMQGCQSIMAEPLPDQHQCQSMQ